MKNFGAHASLIAVLAIIAGCGGNSTTSDAGTVADASLGANAAVVTGAPEGTFAISSVYAYYDQTTPYGQIVLTSVPNGCAEAASDLGTPNGARTLFIAVASQTDKPLLGTYSLQSDPPLTVFNVIGDAGNGDEWQNTGGTVDITDNTKDGLRGTFDIPLQENVDTNNSGTGPTAEMKGSFDAVYCGPPLPLP